MTEQDRQKTNRRNQEYQNKSETLSAHVNIHTHTHTHDISEYTENNFQCPKFGNLSNKIKI